MRFTVPLDRVATVWVFGLIDEVLLQRAAARRADFCNLAAHLEDAVKRAVERTSHVGDDKIHGQKVLVELRLLTHGVGKCHEFANGYELAVGAAHSQLE